MPENWDSSKPHPDPRREKYCLSRNAGAGPSQSYRLHLAGPKTTAASVKSAAHHIDRNEHIAARLSFLRRETADRLDVPDELNGQEIKAIFEEVSDALEMAHRVAEGSTASESDLSKIRRIWTTHLNRMDAQTTPDKKANTPSRPLNFAAVYECECGHD